MFSEREEEDEQWVEEIEQMGIADYTQQEARISLHALQGDDLSIEWNHPQSPHSQTP
jgi:hypothetical protein